jgi:sec-independent protein translocase protein TatA
VDIVIQLLTGYEMIVVVGVLVVVFLWGPQKLPEMARAIGQAKAEYEKVAKAPLSLTDPLGALTNLATGSQTPAAPASPTAPMVAPTAAPSQPVQTHQDPILIAAKSLGLSTEGKTKEQLAKEITDRTSTSTGPTAATSTASAPSASETPKT